MKYKTLTKFSDVQYTRPDFDKVRTFYEELSSRVQQAKSYADVKQGILEEEEFSSHFQTMGTVMMIRHTVDTSDKFYEEEDEFFNQAYPEVMPYMQSFNMALLNSPFRKDIDAEYGEQLLKQVQLSVDSFSEKNVTLMQEESELVNRYQKIIASCKIHFDGQELPTREYREWWPNILPAPRGRRSFRWRE